jgi:3-methyl-2-oxobutanoate hydroxymethyltransferase
MSKLHPRHIISAKQDGRKISMLAAYDYQTASLIDDAGIDMILVGDSMGNVFSGYENTLPVEMDHMVYHTQAVARAAKRSMVVGDLPFLSYQISNERAKENAGRLIKEGGAQAVKIEIVGPDLSVVSEIVNMGIPVMGHIGFTPQKLYQLGGYKVQGRNASDQELMKSVAMELESRGCFSVILEMVPSALSKEITDFLHIPTIGIGAGPHCDGQILVASDMFGITEKTPKFVKRYMNGREAFQQALATYKTEIEDSVFPDEEHSY